MSKNLVIVESPTKARTISRYLGSSVQVLASQGHIRDLPQKELGVDIANHFKPTYELTPNGKKTVKLLKAAASNANQIYLATDPDREGEAIAWHLQEILKSFSNSIFHRITFHEITHSAIERSFQQPGTIDYNMVDAQQARRVLDRVVGYQVSPMLWKHIQKGTSAGRVQTVALRLVVEREKEIRAFQPVEYWNLDAFFSTQNPVASFKARLIRVNDNKLQLTDGESALRIENALQSQGVTHQVSKVTSTPYRKSAPPPFITSTLQQAAGSALRIGASQTMRIAQELYEGIDLGNGQVGLITYMRTDSVNIAKEAQTQAREYIKNTFGPQYVPEKPNVYRSRKTAQEAHEAIRPTSMQYVPEAIAGYLTPQQLKIYKLIWNRFLASQMSAAQQMNHLIEAESKGGDLMTISSQGLTEATPVQGITCTFRASARETIFPGFLKAYSYKEVDEEEEDSLLNTLPQLPLNTPCQLQKLDKAQCFTQPPARFSEASLVKALEQNGVGRPSTYATTVNTIQERKYVDKEKGSLIPTDLGMKVCDYLTTQMPQLFDIGFTAQMEDELDQVEGGKLDWVKMLEAFYGQFKQWLDASAVPPQLPTNGALDAILECFTPEFPFDEPISRGSKTYDDAKFIFSLKEQNMKKKAPSERQWGALLFIVAKYMERHPNFNPVLQQYGYLEKIRALRETLDNPLPSPAEHTLPEIDALLKGMENVQYNPPKKRGGRTYDDQQFVKSLRLRCNAGRGLSDLQIKALVKIASNYAAMIPDYAALIANLAQATGMQLDIHPASADTDSAPTSPRGDQHESEEIVRMLEEVKQWAPVTTKGRFKFDDKKFAESVITQFHQKGALSDKQLSALQKLLEKYKEQIQNYSARLQALNLISVATLPTELNETCPLCGAKLLLRTARGSSFKGCSNFPKCRYVAKIN